MIVENRTGSEPVSVKKYARISKAATKAVERWHDVRIDRDSGRRRSDGSGNIREDGPKPDVLQDLPRRPRLTRDVVQDIQPRLMRLAHPFKAGFLFCLLRLLIWIYGICRFLLGTLRDIVLRRDTIDRRAVRLRVCLEKIGGTFLKIGQQASVRIDLIPHRYCVELTRLLDKTNPFPTEQAIRIVERETGQELSQIFAAFDPKPIGSASIACVFQAVLHNGEKVAVKVRRPGVGKTITADLRVLGWLFKFMELMTLVRPGYTANVLQELRDTLMEELDFYKEARFQELFRRRARKSGRTFFSAPRVFPQFSGEEVLVEEFVSGVWLSEVIAAVENRNAAALAYMRDMNIRPDRVARRLLWASHWGMWENIFFHADPHPANIIVQADSRLVFIDFGSSGTLTESRRLAMHELFAREREEDLEGISRVALTLLEPLPPVDTEKVVNAIEKVFWDAMIAQRSKHSEWWEKTSANLWLGFFKVTSQFKIPMSVDHVRMIRATLLYDTLAARLDNQIDLGAQYRAFMRDAGDKARKRLQKRIRQRVSRGLTAGDYAKLERVIKIGDRALFLGERLLNLRSFNYGALLGKFVSTLISTISLAFQMTILTGSILLVAYPMQMMADPQEITFTDTVRMVVTNPWYIGGLAVIVLINIRRMLFRISDEEIR